MNVQLCDEHPEEPWSDKTFNFIFFIQSNGKNCATTKAVLNS